MLSDPHRTTTGFHRFLRTTLGSKWRVRTWEGREQGHVAMQKSGIGVIACPSRRAVAVVITVAIDEGVVLETTLDERIPLVLSTVMEAQELP